MIQTLFETCGKLSTSETVLKDYIIANAEKAVNSSIEQLAQDAFVSVGCVSRLCKKLGCNGYRELRLKIAEELKEHIRSRVVNESVPFRNDTSLETIINNLPIIYSKAINYTKIILNPSVIEKWTQWIAKDNLVIFGNNQNRFLAESFIYKLEEIGIQAKFFDSIHYQYLDWMRYHDQRVIAILVSHSGHNSNILHISDRMKNRSIPQLLISSRKIDDELYTKFDDVVNIIPTVNTRELSNVQFAMATQYVFDVMYCHLLATHLSDVNAIAEFAGYYDPNMKGRTHEL